MIGSDISRDRRKPRYGGVIHSHPAGKRPSCSHDRDPGRGLGAGSVSALSDRVCLCRRCFSEAAKYPGAWASSRIAVHSFSLPSVIA